MTDPRVEYLDRLRSHWYQSHSDWLTYKNLFDTNQERIELINATVPRFFVQIKGTLLNSAILGVSRLVDSSYMGKRQNFTIKTIPSFFSNPTENKAVAERLKEAVKNTKKLVAWRNRKYAHNDTEIIRGRETLPVIRPSIIDDAMYSTIAVVELAEHYLNIGPYSRRVIVAQAGELDLLWHLYRSKNQSQQVHEKYPDALKENKRNGIPPDGFVIRKP